MGLSGPVPVPLISTKSSMLSSVLARFVGSGAVPNTSDVVVQILSVDVDVVVDVDVFAHRRDDN